MLNQNYKKYQNIMSLLTLQIYKLSFQYCWYFMLSMSYNKIEIKITFNKSPINTIKIRIKNKLFHIRTITLIKFDFI